jgi:hypothetical protein
VSKDDDVSMSYNVNNSRRSVIENYLEYELFESPSDLGAHLITEATRLK